MSQEEFIKFIDQANEAGKLLLSHFAALHLIMTPIMSQEPSVRRKCTSPGGNEEVSARWLAYLNSRALPHMEKYYEWPIFVEKLMVEKRLALCF